MTALLRHFPNPDVMLALPSEELAATLLRLAQESRNGQGTFHPQEFSGDIEGRGGQDGYPQNRRVEAELAVAEAWNWLQVKGLVLPAPGTNGQNGWTRLSRKASGLVHDQPAFVNYARGVSFPKSLLHPTIADDVWLDIARGELSIAVLRAFRAVEIRVRAAGGFNDDVVGVDLMRRAFNSANGPLTDPTQPAAEREALSALFAGSIGSYKNPHSHRTVDITDPSEAQEMVILASHLLRIVDSRSRLVGRTGAPG